MNKTIGMALAAACLAGVARADYDCLYPSDFGNATVGPNAEYDGKSLDQLVQEDLAKARALGDALVRAQQPSGRIPTCLTVGALDPKTHHVDWLNCMISDFEALVALAEAK